MKKERKKEKGRKYLPTLKASQERKVNELIFYEMSFLERKSNRIGRITTFWPDRV